MDNAFLLDLEQQYGSPLYVYDGAKIKEKFQALVKAVNNKNLKIHFAIKALSNIHILKLLSSLGSKMDAVSIGEVNLALLAGIPANDIMFTPNSVSINEIEEAMDLGVMLNIDNIETLELLGHNYPGISLGIRLNPHVMAGGNSKISVGHIDSKFGISVHQLPLVHRIVESLGIKIDGLHMHTGSDILDINVFLQAADILFQSALQFKDLNYIDFGSGFKVQYKQDDYYTDIEEFGGKISHRFMQFCKEYGREIDLIFEPGKYLVSEAGFFLAKVNVIKQTTSTVFACLNSGFNHLIRPMFYEAYHEIYNASNPSGKPRLYSVVGYICETDTFAYNRKIGEVTSGDILVFKNAGAYCFSMASNYNSRTRPAEVLVNNGIPYLIRERETLDDLTSKLTNVDIFSKETSEKNVSV